MKDIENAIIPVAAIQQRLFSPIRLLILGLILGECKINGSSSGDLRYYAAILETSVEEVRAAVNLACVSGYILQENSGRVRTTIFEAEESVA
jgi:hypothetical protein